MQEIGERKEEREREKGRFRQLPEPSVLFQLWSRSKLYKKYFDKFLRVRNLIIFNQHKNEMFE